MALGLEGGSCTSAVLGCTPAAVRYSLDSQPWARVGGGELHLSGLAPGRHGLQLRAENPVGNFDNTSRQLSFVAEPLAGIGGGEASPLSVTEGPLNVTTSLTNRGVYSCWLCVVGCCGVARGRRSVEDGVQCIVAGDAA